MPLENREVYPGEMKLGLENGSSRAREKRHRALNTSGESNGRLMCIISFDGRVGRGTGWETPFRMWHVYVFKFSARSNL